MDTKSGEKAKEAEQKGANEGRSAASIAALVLAIVLALGLVGAMVALWQLFGEGGTQPPEIALFIGQFHPVFVHIPVTLLVVVLLMELLSLVPPWRGLRQNTLFLLWLASLGAAGAIVAGFFLRAGGEYSGPRVESHMWLGFGVAAGSWAALVLKSAGADGAFYRLLLLVTAVALVLAGHLGGTITHGADYLVRHMPEPYRSHPLLAEGRFLRLFAKISGGDKPAAKGLLYDDYVAPVLADRCTMCHGEDKQKGKLRLDTHEWILAGAEGSDRPSVVPGKPDESEILARVRLPIEDEDHMPPEDEAQMTPAEVMLLEWWIANGARADLRVAEARADAGAAAILKELGAAGAAAGNPPVDGAGPAPVPVPVPEAAPEPAAQPDPKPTGAVRNPWVERAVAQSRL